MSIKNTIEWRNNGVAIKNLDGLPVSDIPSMGPIQVRVECLDEDGNVKQWGVKKKHNVRLTVASRPSWWLKVRSLLAGNTSSENRAVCGPGYQA